MDINRKAAYEALLDVEIRGAYSNIAVNKAIEKFKPEDEAFVRNLVYGVLENKIYLDYKLSRLVKSGLGKVKPKALVLLELGAYQIEFANSVPSYAAINESVTIARKTVRGLEGFINGVLRSYDRQQAEIQLPSKEETPADYLSIKYSYHRDIAEMWLRMYGFDRTERLMKAGNAAPPLTIRVNTLKTSAEALTAAFEKRGIKAEAVSTGNPEYDRILKPMALKVTGSGVISSDLYKEGMFSVQDISSMLAVSSLAPAPGETFIDLCAAPGGKSLCAAELMKNQGRIISCDIFDHKLKLMTAAAERTGAHIMETRINDGTLENPEFSGLADAVLVDAPCSGLGVVRRKPEIKLHTSQDDIRNLAEIQVKILENATKYVKPGGRLMYSTCTVSDVENRGVLELYLQKNKNIFVETEIQLMSDSDSADGFYFARLKGF